MLKFSKLTNYVIDYPKLITGG